MRTGASERGLQRPGCARVRPATPRSASGAGGCGNYRGGVLRTALRPRWLALLALALAVAGVFAALGSWQLDRSRAEVRERGLRAQAAQDPVPLAEVLAPQQAVTTQASRATVTVEGGLEADRVRLSPRRELDGRTGSWVVVPVVVDGTDPPARLAVLLGWQAGDDVPRVDGGAVDLTGVLRGSEAPSGADADGSGPGGTVLETVSTADLLNVWGAPVYTAYLVASAEDARAAGLEPVPTEPEARGLGFDLQNLSYALEWWVFAAFALFVWWRVVRDTHRAEQLPPEDPPAADGAPDPEPVDPEPVDPEPATSTRSPA